MSKPTLRMFHAVKFDLDAGILIGDVIYLDTDAVASVGPLPEALRRLDRYDAADSCSYVTLINGTEHVVGGAPSDIGAACADGWLVPLRYVLRSSEGYFAGICSDPQGYRATWASEPGPWNTYPTKAMAKLVHANELAYARRNGVSFVGWPDDAHPWPLSLPEYAALITSRAQAQRRVY